MFFFIPGNENFSDIIPAIPVNSRTFKIEFKIKNAKKNITFILQIKY